MFLRCVSRLNRPCLRLFPRRTLSSTCAWSHPDCRQVKNLNFLQRVPSRTFSHTDLDLTKPLDLPTYDHICSETLESLTEFYEQAVEECPHLKDADVTFGDGVLTIHFGAPYGSYVINRQRPNLQIWLSSPTSGPKRYDFVNGRWIYKHDGVCLHHLLEQETSAILKKLVDLSGCSFYRV